MVGKPIVKNWIILIALVISPFIGGYYLLGDMAEADTSVSDISATTAGESDISDVDRVTSDNQNTQFSDNDPPAGTSDTAVQKTDSGIEISTTKGMTEPTSFMDKTFNTKVDVYRFNHVTPDSPEKTEKVIHEFLNSPISVEAWSSCTEIETWYEYFYFDGGKNKDGLWSYNQDISDFFKAELISRNCTFFELAEGNKEKLDQQQVEIEHILTWLEQEQARYDELHGAE